VTRVRLLDTAGLLLVGGAFALVLVAGTPRPHPATAPLVVIDEPQEPGLFHPWPWRGDVVEGRMVFRREPDVQVAFRRRADAPSRTHALEVRIPAGAAQAGVEWRHPAGNLGFVPGVRLEDASELRVWLRGGTGGETVHLRLGGTRGPHADSHVLYSPPIRLTDGWREHRFGLDGADLSNLVSALGIFRYARDNPGDVRLWIDGAVLE